MPLALSGEALMQALHAFFTHWSEGVLPSDPGRYLPWYPLAHRPHPWSSINFWPFITTAGRVHYGISTLEETLHFDSICEAARARTLADPAISARPVFNTGLHPVGSIVKGKACPLRYPSAPQAAAEWVDTNSDPLPPSRHLLIRLLNTRCSMLQLHKRNSMHAFRLHSQGYTRDLVPGPPNMKATAPWPGGGSAVGSRGFNGLVRRFESIRAIRGVKP